MFYNLKNVEPNHLPMIPQWCYVEEV